MNPCPPRSGLANGGPGVPLPESTRLLLGLPLPLPPSAVPSTARLPLPRKACRSALSSRKRAQEVPKEMVQKSQKNKQDQTSFCLVPGVGVEAQTGQLSSAVGGCQYVDSRLADQPLLEQPSDKSELLTPISEVPVETKEEEPKKLLVSKRREGRSCGKCVRTVLEDKAKVNFAVDTNLKEEESLVGESCSKKAAQGMGRQQRCAASKSTLQKEFVSHLRWKRSSSLLCEKDIAPKKNCICSLLEPELNISSCLEKEKKSKEKSKKTFVKAELKNLVERDGSSTIVLESQKAVRESNKRSVSKPGPLQKSWHLRERIRSAQPEQKSFRDKRQRVKRRCLSLKLQTQNLSLQKFKGKRGNGDFSYELQLPSLDSEDCTRNLVKVRSSSVPRVPCGNVVEGRESLWKSCRVSLPNLRLVEPQGEEQTLQKTCKSCSAEWTQTKSCEDLQALKQDSRCLLKSVACIEDSKKCRSIAEEGRHRMVTRALLKSKIRENDSEKLDWMQEKPVAMEIPWFRQGILEKQIAIGKIVDSAPTEGRIISRVTVCSEKQTQGKDEIMTTPELKIKIKTSREQKTEVSSEKLAETDLNTSQDCSIPKLLEQSACLQINKLDETEHKDPVSCCLRREATLHCGDSAFPVTNSRCPQFSDIKITENQVEKDPLVVYQDDKLRCLTKLNDFTCRITKNPVVRLLDCRYIKALLNPTSDHTIQSYKLHCEFLHIALGQRKDLCPHRGMGQSDLNCSSNIVQAGGSTSISVGKGMCQKKKMPPRYQNGKKRFRESKWCLEFKKNSKRIKMTEDLEKQAVQELLSNRDLYKATANSSIITEQLNCNEAVSFPSLDVPDLPLKKNTQKHPNQFVTLAGNKRKNQSHFTLYDVSDFAKSDAKKENSALESKTMDPHRDLTSTAKDDSAVEMLVDEKIPNYSSNNAGYMQGGKAAPKAKTVSKTGKKLPFSCQRIVPFSGKNIWLRESCARTSLFCKNHVYGSKFLRRVDSFANTGQVELHELLVDTSNLPANKTMDCKTELSVKSPAAESQIDNHKAVSGIGNKNGISSTDMERPKQCPSSVTKNAKKCKITSKSPGKDTKKEDSMVKTNVSIGTQNGIFVDSSKNKAKSLVSKQETAVPRVPKTLSMGNLSNFRIPLLKDKSVLRKERTHYSPQSILDCSAASVKKNRSKRVSSDFEHLFHSEQISNITVAAVEEHRDQFDSSVAGSFPWESSICNKDLATSHESDLELSGLENVSNSLSIGCTKKPTESSVISSEIYEDNWSNTLAQNKDKLCADVLKAYEDDALVIDVIQDDPDLFGNTDEPEVTGSNEHVPDSDSRITISSEENLVLKSESSPLPRSDLLKFRPKESPLQAHDTLRSTTDVSASLSKVDETKSDSLSRTSLTRGTTELSFKREHLTELEEFSRSSDSGVKTYFGLILPRGYCRSHFNTLNGCRRPKCWYAHVPEPGDSKLCNEILKKYISIGEIVLLQRAVQIFTEYYKDVTRGVQLDSQMLNDLLMSLLRYCLLKELFHILQTCLLIKVLPAVDVLIKVFEHVASMKLKEVVPELINISSKLVDVGMVLESQHLGYIAKFLNQLQISSKEINIFMSRFQARHFYQTSICDFSPFGSAIAEFQHCKEKGEWTKLGIVYVHVRRECENFDELEKYSLFIANVLTNAAKEDRPGIPFCEFAAAVHEVPWHNEADKTLLGRIGISVLYAYYKIQEWLKARKILDTLHTLKIHFSYLKGLIGPEEFASQCEIVNVAVEVFLNSGSLDGAVWILKESEWVINTLSWSCDRMDVLNRHNLLCKIASEFIIKNCYMEAFEVLQNLPGFQNSCDSLDVSQYSLLFNNLLGASLGSKNLGISSAIINFMLAKNINVDFQLLRAFITALGRSSALTEARTYYRSALGLGCYPPPEGNLYRKVLLIPSYVTEIEMLLATEVFLASNASSIQSPGASNQILQIVLQRCKGNRVQNTDDYQSAVERLIQATQLASPKLFIKHLTINVNQEQVYSLEHQCVLEWLKKNMKWAGKVWLFQ
uniref:protein TOPAZ1 n=1 Tax=Euleptes europaea TaxID=460621 RepID=UPI00254261E5|nr:protein TOPAZ1 [Euleptes europaea]